MEQNKERGGRMDDIGVLGATKFRSLIKNGKFFDMITTERQTKEFLVLYEWI